MQQGVPSAEAAQQAAEARAGNTMGHALLGFIGTLITGILATAVIAIWVRSRHPIPGPVK